MLQHSNTSVPVDEMAEAAVSASLTYCSDNDAGFRRVKDGKLFDYRKQDGSQLRDKGHLERIRALAIPPAWTDVWIAPKADCHLQATGRDAKGRKQYRYHERWTTCRDEVKFDSLVEFARALPKLRKAVERDLRRKGLVREKVIATIVWLLDNVMIRVGNAEYARDNKSFGLTTLRDRHAAISGGKLKLTFRGKSGKDWSREIHDRRIARIVKGVQDIPGQHLFQYLDAEGGRHSVTSNDVNAYIADNAGVAFTSKHFRTWGGTVHAAWRLADLSVPDTETGRKRALNEVIDEVSGLLGNTRAVCRRCYIHPRAIDQWADGSLVKAIAEKRRRISRAPTGMTREESIVLRWLDNGTKTARKRAA
jgi:DNA topoisomerase-1